MAKKKKDACWQMTVPSDIPEEARHGSSSLGAVSARGGLLMLSAQAVVFGTNFVGIIILARMLSPEMFGIMAMAATVANFIMMFRDFGMTTPVMQRRQLSQEQISALYWANVGFGLVLTALAIASAPVFAWFYDTPDLNLIVAVLASGFLLATGGAMQDALLRRHMKYRALAIIRIAASFAALASGVALAWAGYGIWALVSMRLVQQACYALGAWIASSWRPGWHLKAAGMRTLLGTAGHVSGAQLASYLSRNADNVLIGWYWGGHALGLYDQAYRLLLFPIQQLGAPLNSVLLPLLSRLADDPDAYRRTYRRVAEKLVILTMPLTCLMLVLPQTVVDVALGPQWSEAAPIIAWLGIAMIYQPLAFTTNCLLISQNRSGLLLRNSLISAALSMAAFVIGLPYGPEGVAASYAVSGLLIRMPFTFWQVGRKGPVSLRDQFALFIPALWSGAILATAFHFLRTAPVLAENPFWLLGAAALVALPVTVLALAVLPSGRALMSDSLTMTKLALSRQRRRTA
jgi:O-antigen/teichoic acid export membrane protein